jgi:glycosyltransferase involved in cell wall biosynthesis
LKYDDFTVVIPTLDEEENIGTLIGHLLRTYDGISIIVADGGSTDNTRKFVQEISRKNKRVRFLPNPYKKSKRSVTQSLAEGIIASRTKYSITMDADMQHPYMVVGKIAALLKEGNQIVPGVRIGSRNWGIHRVVISKMLNYIGHAILFLKNKERCYDDSTGFFGIERKLFAKTYRENKKRYVIDGIRVFYDTIKCMDYGKYRMAQVPFTFDGREDGRSKMGFKQGIKAIQSFTT